MIISFFCTLDGQEQVFSLRGCSTYVAFNDVHGSSI
jgi:hypothetical protein